MNVRPVAMPSLDQLIRFAYQGFSQDRAIPILPHEDVESVRQSLALTPSAFFDCFARRVAHEYFAEKLTFEIADCAMNSLDGYCLAQYDVTLPSYANDVYLAFDKGERRLPGDDNPEIKYTRPEIQALVVRDRILGVPIEVA